MTDPAQSPAVPEPSAKCPECEQDINIDENGDFVAHKCPLYANQRRRGGEQFHCPGSHTKPLAVPEPTPTPSEGATPRCYEEYTFRGGLYEPDSKKPDESVRGVRLSFARQLERELADMKAVLEAHRC